MLRRRPSSFKHRRGPRKPSPTRTPIPLLEELKSTADPAAALRRLQHADPDLLTYPVCSSLLYRLAKARLIPEIDSLLALLRAHRVPCKEAAFNSLIRRFGTDGLPDRAVDLFHALRSFEFSISAPSVQSLNSALVALVENRRFEQARALLAQSAAAFGLRPNAVSYNILIQGCCVAEGFSSARLLFDEMLQKGIRPTVVTYNVLIGHSAKNGDLGTGARLKEEMVRRGVQPNAITFALLMDALCREGNYATAMVASGHCPREETFRWLMNGLCGMGKVEAAWSVLEEMARRKMELDGNGWKALVEATIAPAKPEQQLDPVQFNSTHAMTLLDRV